MTATATGVDPAKLRLHIGLTGQMGTGKGEAVRILQAEGFRYISLSDMVREEARRLGRPVDREAMQDTGNRLRREGGGGVLGERVAAHIRARPEVARWVIDGIRNPMEVRALRELPSFFLLGVSAPPAIILERLARRGRDTDRLPEAELQARLAREWGEGEPPDGQRVGDCMALADHVLANDGDLATLELRLRRWLADIEATHDQHT